MIKNPSKVNWVNNPQIVTVSGIIRKYRLSYIIIPIYLKTIFMDRFGYDYDHFKSVYENNKLTIYKVVP